MSLLDDLTAACLGHEHRFCQHIVLSHAQWSITFDPIFYTVYPSLQLALADSPDLSLRVVRLLVYCGALSDRLLPVLDEERLILLHCLNSLSFDTVDELLIGGDIVDEANDLASGPYLGLSASCTQEKNGGNLHQSPCLHSRRLDVLAFRLQTQRPPRTCRLCWSSRRRQPVARPCLRKVAMCSSIA